MPATRNPRTEKIEELEAGLHVDQGQVGLVLDGRPQEAADRSMAGTGEARDGLVHAHGMEQGYSPLAWPGCSRR